MSLNIDPIISDEKISKTEIQPENINWKKILTNVVGSDLDQATSLREWSTFSQKLRNLCPESQWLFIREEDKQSNDKEIINKAWEWINHLVANPKWPFPEKIICSIESKRTERFIRLTILSSKKTIPFVSPPEPLCVAPWIKDEAHGWKIFYNNTPQFKKSGQA